MTATTVSVTGFAVLAIAGIGIEAYARRRRTIAPAGPALAAAMQTPFGRVAVLTWWLWLGVHFLAR